MNKLLALLAAVALAATLHAQTMPVSLGVRVGINESTLAADRLMASGGMQQHQWCPGANVGVVAAFKFSRNFALQPGFFIDILRSHYNTDITMLPTVPNPSNPTETALRHTSGNTTVGGINIPVLFSYRIPLGGIVEFQLNAGPYFSWAIGGHDTHITQLFGGGQITDPNPPKIKTNLYATHTPALHRSDGGVKAGVGILLFKHYHVAAHYLYGMRNIAADRTQLDKAHFKQWQFTLGYNF